MLVPSAATFRARQRCFVPYVAHSWCCEFSQKLFSSPSFMTSTRPIWLGTVIVFNIVEIFHCIFLLQLIKCAVRVHNNISKIPSKVGSYTCNTCFTSNSPMRKKNKKQKRRYNFELSSCFVACSNLHEKKREGVATGQQLRTLR